MKNVLLIFSVFVILSACSTGDEPGTAERSSTYLLYRANYNPVSGDVTVRELAPGQLQFHIKLQNTTEGGEHPAHLHFGSVREVGELAFALNPVDGSTGESVTVLDGVQLSDGSMLTYDNFLEMDASIKVHMNDNYFKHMVLSFGNVGKNENYFFDGVAMCTGH